MKTFIKQERERRDIMQKDLALEMCIAPATLATYENTDRDPPLEILCKMADKFDCSLDQLIHYVRDYNLTIRKMKKKSVDVNALKKKRDKLTDLYMEDLIDKVKYEADFKSLTTAIEEAERQPKEMDTEEIKTVLEAYKGLSPLAKKAFWSNLIKSITPTKDGYIFTVNYT